MKVVLNKCYGGFGLSDAAIEKLIEMGMTAGKEGCDIYDNGGKSTDRYYINKSSETSFRTDPRVIQVVEEMGEDSWGDFAELRIVEVPDDASWEIEEYDGIEWIAETHRTWS